MFELFVDPFSVLSENYEPIVQFEIIDLQNSIILKTEIMSPLRSTYVCEHFPSGSITSSLCLILMAKT